MDDARASLGEAGQTNVIVLLLETRSLGLGWDRFHDGYDEWRRTNGGCDQGGALEALGQLARDFGQTVRDIQALPTGPLIRGMGEELVQAAEREQAAVQSLRETWCSRAPAPLAGIQQTGHSPSRSAGRQHWTCRTCLNARE